MKRDDDTRRRPASQDDNDDDDDDDDDDDETTKTGCRQVRSGQAGLTGFLVCWGVEADQGR
ncbi:hypothetical protein LY76DRAFT_596327 [Colletotrichum caudatum]|nr:hypothetical protein LY76DRAFT_596327 [Colletotrichum caudatum]